LAFFNKKETHDYFPYRDYLIPKEVTIPLMYCLNEPNYNDLLIQCDFKLNLCKKSEFQIKNRSERILALYTISDFINLIKFIHYILFVFLNQIFAFIGILTNIIVVVVVANNKNLNKGKRKQANNKKDNMFMHIMIHFAFNYCFIMMFKLINICPFFTPSLFCSSIASEIVLYH
jgi:hypothetical protein